jgi:hypothetical protein
LFHASDIGNIISILRTGYLFSRVRIKNEGLEFVNGASRDIISGTPEVYQDYVRLYFRPRTPFLHNTEGIRPLGQYDRGAHCPVPVFLLFDLKSIICETGVKFTDGNLAASRVQIYDDFEGLKNIPFDLVYHDYSFPREERDAIVFHRHAEVLVPFKLRLDGLKYIVCRSKGEYDTLLNLLERENVSGFRRLVRQRNDLFFKKWTFIEKVDLSSDLITIWFNPDSEKPEPFGIRAEIAETSTGINYFWVGKDIRCLSPIKLDLTNLSSPGAYSVDISIDDHIAYIGIYKGETELV